MNRFTFLNRYTPIWAFVLLSACQAPTLAEIPTPEPEVRTYPLVDEALHAYFQRFEEAAEERGYTYDLAALGIVGKIEELEEEHVAGQCSYGGFQPREVSLDATFWKRAPNILKEMIVFHELGHCVLFRDHLEDKHANGTCVSIMRSGREDCRDNYNTVTRPSYLDELFQGD